MAEVLDSYIADFTELALVTNYRIFRQLCSVDEEGVSPVAPFVPGTPRSDRAILALNYGRQQVDAVLTGTYEVPLTAPVPMIVKRWSIMFALLWLYQFHADRAEDALKMEQAIQESMEPYIRSENPLYLPGRSRTPTGVQGGNLRPIDGSIYDSAEQWPNRLIRDQDGG